LGALLTKNDQTWSSELVPAGYMTELLDLLLSGKITTSSARHLLSQAFNGDLSSPAESAEAQGLLISNVSDDKYNTVLDNIIQNHPDVVEAVQNKGQKGKVMWLVGQAIREMKSQGNSGGVQPEKIKELLLRKLNITE
jgi:aspartyl-tRNA(Asn)/glutamyl-tRNA(Gln) amidotransferase subunit B